MTRPSNTRLAAAGRLQARAVVGSVMYLEEQEWLLYLLS